MSHSYHEGTTENHMNQFINMRIKGMKPKNMRTIPYLKQSIINYTKKGMYNEADAAERRLEKEKSKGCIGRSCNTVKYWIGYGTGRRKTHRRKSRSRRTRSRR